MAWMFFGKYFWRIARDIELEFRRCRLRICMTDVKDNLISRGGEVRLRATIRGLEISDGGISGVAFDSGEVLRADYYVAAVPQDVLLELLPAEVTASQPAFENLKQLKTSPITGVHFWFDRVVMDEPFLTLVDTTTQWIFNKNVLYGGDSSGGTIPAAGD